MKYSFFFKGLALTLAMLFTSTLHATLISADLNPGTGDEYLTIDTSQNLEFLDLTLTNGLSSIDITSGIVNYFDIGFRYASRKEVANLFSESGTFIDAGGYYSENYDSANTLLNLLGILCCVAPTFDSSTGIYLESGVYEFGAFSADHSTKKAQISHYIGHVTADFSSEYWGHYLVREVSSTKIPEPTSLILLLTGGILLMGKRYRIIQKNKSGIQEKAA